MYQEIINNNKSLKVMKPAITNLQNNPSDSTSELIQKCRSCDQRAQLQVYKLYYKRVFSLCMQLVNDRNTAEDLMHESFLLAFENINSYSGDVCFSSWVNKFTTSALKYGHFI